MATSAIPPGGGEAYRVAPVAAPPAKLRPGRVWYWVALCGLAGIGGAITVAIIRHTRATRARPPAATESAT